MKKYSEYLFTVYLKDDSEEGRARKHPFFQCAVWGSDAHQAKLTLERNPAVREVSVQLRGGDDPREVEVVAF